jgi:regulatory protein
LKITAIEPQKHHAERVNVHVDGEFRLALALEIAYGVPLRVGDEVSEAQLEELARRDQLWKAKEAALNLLSFRPRPAAELRRRLKEKEYPAEVADEVVEGLVSAGLVDDAGFAGMFVRDRVRLKPKGRRRLVQELRAKGVDEETARAAVEEAWEGEEVSDVALAREAAARWSPRAGEEREKARRRLYAFLARRGFDHDAIFQVLEERVP